MRFTETIDPFYVIRGDELITGFPPISDPRARVLILGSMPGQASLDAQAYYAHPRNAFWPIMGTLLDFDPALEYARRCAALLACEVAVWDVLSACRRQGSLDSAIEPDSLEVNDFGLFFQQCPRIRQVFFNGQKAAALFRRRVSGELHSGLELHLATLPSTSPAHAAMAFEEKLAAWQPVAAHRDVPVSH